LNFSLTYIQGQTNPAMNNWPLHEVNLTEMKNLTYTSVSLVTRHKIEIQNNYLLNFYETNQVIQLVFTCMLLVLTVSLNGISVYTDYFKTSSTEVKGFSLSYPHSIKF
jgi:hypothetical protein